MKLRYHKNFSKQYKKLSVHQKEKVDAAILLFQKNPYHPLLKNHTLKGKRKDIQSISAGFDLRILFHEYNNYTYIIFLTVGSHNQVYS